MCLICKRVPAGSETHAELGRLLESISLLLAFAERSLLFARWRFNAHHLSASVLLDHCEKLSLEGLRAAAVRCSGSFGGSLLTNRL